LSYPEIICYAFSGRLDAEFDILNVESSNNYTLLAPTIGKTFVSQQFDIHYVDSFLTKFSLCAL